MIQNRWIPMLKTSKNSPRRIRVDLEKPFDPFRAKITRHSSQPFPIRSALILEVCRRPRNGTPSYTYGEGGEEEEGSISVLSRCRWNKWIRSVTVVNPRYRWHDPHTLARTHYSLPSLRRTTLRLLPALPLSPRVPRQADRGAALASPSLLSHLRARCDTIVVVENNAISPSCEYPRSLNDHFTISNEFFPPSFNLSRW